MKRMIVLALVLSLALMLGCQNGKIADNIQEDTEAPDTKTETDTDNDTDTEQEQIDQTEASEFSLKMNGTIVSLKDSEPNVNLEQVLGKPLSQDIEELSNADTFTGSFIKRLTYDGLQIEMFSPKDNGKNFWIMSMNVSQKGYETSKGIEVGHAVEEVKDVYPKLSVVEDGRTDPNNCAYEIRNEQEYNYLQFEVKEGVVSEIKIFHLLP